MNKSELRPKPLISIITVTYNASATLQGTMRSIKSQTFEDYEHIIMDGVSADNTLKIAEKEGTDKTRIFSSVDNGIYDAMNKALGIARGEFVLFLNSGDTFSSQNVLEKFSKTISEEPLADIIYGQTVLVDSSGTIVGQRHLTAPMELTVKSFAEGMVVCHQAFMVRRSIAPLYDIKFKFSADYDWCIICLQNSRKNIYLGDDPVIHYLNEGLTTRNHKASLMERYEIMCHYYGTFPTLLKHLSFARRYLKRYKEAPNIQ